MKENQDTSSPNAPAENGLPQSAPSHVPCRFKLLWAALGALAVIYAVIFIAQMSEAYVDFGDGNYLYIAQRLNDGLVLYRDILSPQPPIHVCVGALLLKLGGWIGSPLYTVRVFSMLLHLLTMVIVALLALKIFKSAAASIAAAILYLLIPIGFWWALGFQSEPFEMAFLLASTLFFLNFTPRSLLVAGALAAAAPFCNMTAVPFLLFNIVFLLVRRPRLLVFYLAPIAVIGAAVAGAFEWATGAYFQNVFFNQVGTFPKEEILRASPSGPQTLAQYVISKLVSQGAKVLMFDGPWIVWGLAGLALIPASASAERPARLYVIWLLVAGLLSIGFVAKGATMDYIFTLGEPILCVAAGGMWAAALCAVFGYRLSVIGFRLSVSGSQASIPEGQSSIINRQSSITVLAVLAVLGVVWFGWLGAPLIARTLRGEQYEMSHEKMQWVKEMIGAHSKPGEAIIAHPYFAFLTGRRLVEEYSEIFIWNIKYANEMIVDKRPGEGAAKLGRMAQAIRDRRVPVVFLDMNQTGRHEMIRAALRAGRYELQTDALRSLNTPFEVWVVGK